MESGEWERELVNIQNVCYIYIITCIIIQAMVRYQSGNGCVCVCGGGGGVELNHNYMYCEMKLEQPDLESIESHNKLSCRFFSPQIRTFLFRLFLVLL